ncbi:MAG: glycosyltransferase N-terminal domain-containing protein, partial [Candidatus Zixiibacteriota bacterium]
MLLLYKLIFYFIYYLSYPYGMLKAAGGDLLWQGRLGNIDNSSAPIDLWLHAASVGEIKVIGYLIDYLHKRNPELKIHISTMTRTGFSTAT